MFGSKVLPLALMGIFVIGCSSARSDEGALESGEAEGELREFEGAELKSEDGLRIKVEMLDGAKARTKNRRFIKAKASRGNKSVVMWCDASAHVAKNRTPESKIRCSKGVTTVSNDDDEGLELAIIKSGDKLTAEIGYSGDGTILGDDYRVLAGPNADVERGEAKLALTLGTNRDSIDKNPITLIDRVAAAANAMIGKKVRIRDEDVDARVKITELSAFVSDKMVASFLPTLGSRIHSDAYHDDDASLLETSGQLASGVVSEATMKTRFEKALKVE